MGAVIQENLKRLPSPSFRMNLRGWIYLALTLAVGFAAGLNGNNLLFAIFCILFSHFLVCAILTVAVARRMEIIRVLPDSIYAGESFNVGIRFHNAKKFLPACCLKFEDCLTHDGRPAALQPPAVWLAWAKHGSYAIGSYALTVSERGLAKLGPFTITSSFSPGLFSYCSVATIEDHLLVFPMMGTLNHGMVTSLLSRPEYSERSSAAFVIGDEEFASLRHYRDGDNPRRIHWKMSARLQGKLLVGEYESPKVRNALVLLDTFLPNPNDPRRRLRLERAVTFAATLVESLLADSYTVTFKAYTPDVVSLDLEPRRGALDELLSILAVLKPTHIHSLDDLANPDENEPGSAVFLLRIGNEPLPRWETQAGAITIDASDMKSLMLIPP